jgi:polar amino acid transport system substrate-binding protein
LELVLDSGRLRVAVTRGLPQVIMPGGALEGFDVDVAREIADRLGVGAELIIADGSVTPDDRWDVALTSMEPAPAAADSLTVEPISYWPILGVVPSGSPAQTMQDLTGLRAGMTPGSSATRWAIGELSASGGVGPPAGLTAVDTESDLACLGLLADGEVDVCLVVDLLPADLAARPGLRTLDGPDPVDVRGIVLPRTGPDMASFAEELRNAIDVLRADGTLRELSLRRLGSDVTAPPEE